MPKKVKVKLLKNKWIVDYRKLQWFSYLRFLSYKTYDNSDTIKKVDDVKSNYSEFYNNKNEQIKLNSHKDFFFENINEFINMGIYFPELVPINKNDIND